MAYFIWLKKKEILINPVVRKLRQEDHKSKTGLGYTVREDKEGGSKVGKERERGRKKGNEESKFEKMAHSCNLAIGNLKQILRLAHVTQETVSKRWTKEMVQWVEVHTQYIMALISKSSRTPMRGGDQTIARPASLKYTVYSATIETRVTMPQNKANSKKQLLKLPSDLPTTHIHHTYIHTYVCKMGV